MSDALHTVYLVRHGEASASWGQSADPGLSDLGKQQAIDAGADLQARLNGRDAVVISSPLARAQQTAQPLAATLGLPVQIDERFREIPSTVPLSERQDWLRGFMRGRWDEQPMELHDWRAGIIDALAELPDNSVVFSHFLVINTVVGSLQSRDETLVCWPDNGSITVLTKHSDGHRVELGEQMKTHVN